MGCLAFLGARDQDRIYGINHFGFTVDSMEGTTSRLDDSLHRWKDKTTGKPVEWSFYHPVVNQVNIAERGYLCGGKGRRECPVSVTW